MSLSEFNVTPLFEDSGMSIKTGRTFIGTQEKFRPDALPDATSDSYGWDSDFHLGLFDDLGSEVDPENLTQSHFLH